MTIVLYGHSLDVLNFINHTLLLDVFSCKNHSKMQFDNCTGWLWPMISFWQLYCVAVSFFWQLYCMAVSPNFFLTIVLLFALKFFDNFPIWQKYRNPPKGLSNFECLPWKCFTLNYSNIHWWVYFILFIKLLKKVTTSECCFWVANWSGVFPLLHLGFLSASSSINILQAIQVHLQL